MKKYRNTLIVCCTLFPVFLFSQQHWDSLPGRFQNPNAVRVMYADSNYIYAAGYFDKVGGEYMKGIARWNGMKWDSMGSGIDALDTLNAYPSNTLAIATYHNKLYIGGVFSSLGKVYSPGIGTWDGSAWDSMPVQPFKILYNLYSNGSVLTLTVINDKLYMGGEFDTVAGKACIGIACWNGTSWSSLNFPNYGSLFNNISAICEYQGSIYAGGEFYDSVATDSTAHILRYDSAGWHAVGGGIKGNMDDVWSMVVYNGELYVAGEFLKSEGNYGNNIQKWNGVSWSDVSGGTDSQIEKLIVYNNKLYAMGTFSEAGGIPTSYIAEWDGSKWCSLGSVFDNIINNACTYKDSLYIGGGFWTIDGDSTSYIAEWTGGDYTANCENVTAVNEVKDNSVGIKVHPNPSNGKFTLSYQLQPGQMGVFSMYNALGQKVAEYNLDANSTAMNINQNSLANGVYLYSIKVNNNVVKQDKVVIMK